MKNKVLLLIILISLLAGCTKTITIKTVYVCADNKPEETQLEETEKHNCKFLKELGGSDGKKHYLWSCDEGYKLYSFK